MTANTFNHVVVEPHLTKFRVRSEDTVGARVIQEDPYLWDQTQLLHERGDAMALAELIEEEIQQQIE